MPKRRRENLIEEDIILSKFFTVVTNDHGLSGHQYKSYKHPWHVASTFEETSSHREFLTTGTNFLPTWWRRPPGNSLKNRLDDFLTDMDNWKADAYKVHQQQITSKVDFWPYLVSLWPSPLTSKPNLFILASKFGEIPPNTL